VRIHRVDVLGDDYQFPDFDFEVPGDENRFRDQFWTGRSVSAGWEPPPIFVSNPSLPKPDVTGLFALPLLVFRPGAVERMIFVIQAAGELLPLPVGDEELQVLNVTTVVDCLDPDRSKWAIGKSGTRLWVERHEFLTRRLPESTLFRIPEASSQVFTISGRWSREEEFKPLYEDLGLFGLRFTEVWRSEEEA
jgi:hypothetical protein